MGVLQCFKRSLLFLVVLNHMVLHIVLVAGIMEPLL
jgi:hypothetical protein